MNGRTVIIGIVLVAVAMADQTPRFDLGQIIGPPPVLPPGTIHTLVDCEKTTVDAAVTAASAGDEIHCPAGAATWTSVSIAKRVTLRGSTIIKDLVGCAVGNPSTCTTRDAHGLSSSNPVSIVGMPGLPNTVSLCGSDSLTAPCAYGEHTITVTGTHTFTIPVNVTTARTGGQVMRHDTIITRASDGLVISLNAGASGARVTGFKFIRGGANAGAITDWRIDHNTFDATTSTPGWDEGMTVNSQSSSVFPRGLIDHNNFINARILTQIYNSPTTPPPAVGSAGWSVGVSPGDGDMVFAEDNVFRNSLASSSVNAIDSSFSGRFVARRNVFSGVEGCHFHGVQGDLRGMRWVECYENLQIKEDASDVVATWQRAGSGVHFGGLYVGYGAISILLDNQRSFEDRAVSGRCDGFNTDWDGPALGACACRDQPGCGVDASNATGEPYPDQASNPLYEWDNVTETAGNVSFAVVNGNSTTVTIATSTTEFRIGACASMTAAQGIIVAVDGGAEEASVISSINGSCDVVVSPALSSTPTVGDVVLGRSSMHIRAGRDYFNDTQRPGYVPFRYPHPLTEGRK